MSLPRRAIIHIGGTKKKKIKKKTTGDIPLRRLNLLDSIKRDLISKEGTKFSFTLDPRKPAKNKKVTDFVDINASKNVKSHYEVPVYDIMIGTDEEMKEIDNKEKQELLAQKQEIKRKIKEKYKKKGENDEKRKKMGMGNFLQEIEFDMNYYKDITEKFEKFEKKFFLQNVDEKNKYNPFRFKLSENYKNIHPMPEVVNSSNMGIQFNKWVKKQSLSVIANPIKNQLIGELDQIIKDIYRNAMAFMGRNLELHAQHDNKEQAYFEIIKIALFKSYICLVDKKNTQNIYNKYDFSTTVYVEGYKNTSLKEDDFINEIYKRNENNLSINYNVLDDIIATKLKQEEKRIEIETGDKIKLKLKSPKTIYGQQDSNILINALFITSKENHASIFNIKDAVALYLYVMNEKKIEEFIKFGDFDKKISYKMSLKFFSLLKFVDPYIFTKHDILLHKARKKDKTKKKVGTVIKKVKKIDDMKMGESFFEKTDLFDMSKKMDKEDWLEQEKDKYNVFKDKELSIEEIVQEIESNQGQKDNKNYEAFLFVSKLKQDRIIYSKRDNDNEVNKYFDSGETAMDYYNWLTKWMVALFYSTSGPHNYLINRFNADNYVMKHFWKSLYKYGVDALILYWGIHIKNMRSTYYLNNRSDGNPIMKYNKKDQFMRMLIDTGQKDTYAQSFLFSGPTKNLSGFLLDQIRDDWIIDHNNEMRFYTNGTNPNPHNFNSGIFLNPLTANVNETYVKHFDYCIGLIEKTHGSMNKFNKEFDKLFNKSLILYKNGYMKPSRLDILKKEHPGITIVNNLSEIWEKYKDDKRIYFKKNERHSSDKIKEYDKGWLGNIRGNILSNALDGIYHVDFRKFINDSRNILPPFVDKWYTELDLIKKYKKESKKHGFFETPKNMNKGWPIDSGRPFIFINHIKGKYVKKNGDKTVWKFNKKIYSIDEIKKRINNMKISRIQMPGTSGIFPSYWFPEPKNPFKRVDKNDHIKLKYLVENGKEKYEQELVNMNKVMKIEVSIKPSPETPVISTEPVSLHRDAEAEELRQQEGKEEEEESEDESDVDSGGEEEEESVEEPGKVMVGPVSEGKDDPEDVRDADLEKKDDSEDESEDGNPDLEQIKRKTEELSEDIEDTGRRADELCKNMDHLIIEPDGKFERVKQLVKEGKGDEYIKTTIKREFKGTKDITITCMIDAVKRNQEIESQEPPKGQELDYQPVTSPKGPDQQLKEMGLERVKVKDDGDCLFETFHHILGHPPVPKIDAEEERKAYKTGPIMTIREDITNWITTPISSRKRTIPGPRENPEPTENTVDFWHQYGDRILDERHEINADKQMYPTMDAYKKCMTSIEPNPHNPRCQFGGIFEILAFEEMNNKEIQVIEWGGSKWIVLTDFVRDFDRDKEIDITKPTIIFDREKLHYDYARPIKTAQSGGGNNVYINKCKNHRHKRTRKFRIRLKNVGDWVHVKKPKKRTRRIY